MRVACHTLSEVWRGAGGERSHLVERTGTRSRLIHVLYSRGAPKATSACAPSNRSVLESQRS